MTLRAWVLVLTSVAFLSCLSMVFYARPMVLAGKRRRSPSEPIDELELSDVWSLRLQGGVGAVILGALLVFEIVPR